MAESKLSKTRLFLVFTFFLLALLGLLIKLGVLQILKSSKCETLWQNQSNFMIEIQPMRGRVVDAKGHEYALDLRLDSLYANCRIMKNKPAVADNLASILGLDRSRILRLLNRDKQFVWIARKMSPPKAEAVKKLKVEGLDLVKESLRVYPKGAAACQLVGFTDVDSNGLEGIERFYNSFLKGARGWKLGLKDAKQRELVSKEVEAVPPVDGFNVHLTIDEVIQSMADKELAVTCKKYNAIGGSILVLDPKTGDILAMATYPVYDLNNARNSKSEYRRNRPITDLFEPGSVFKGITLSSILENKIFPLTEKFDCEHGSWAVAGKVLHDHHGSGVLTFREVIERSSNIGTVKGAIKLGASKLYDTIRRFGFGSKTGIGLLGEVSGIVPHPASWSRSSIINIPIGQGVAVTPIQLAVAFAAIANDGLLMKPRIVSYIDDSEGRVIQTFEPEEVRSVLSKETSLQVRSVLEGVVSRGTGKKAAVSGFKAAGKTGTAQKIVNGLYSHDKFFASFVGFVPYDEPRLVISVNIDEPHPVIFGGEVSAPAFSRLSEAILAYWQVPRTEIPIEAVKNVSKALKKKTAAQ